MKKILLLAAMTFLMQSCYVTKNVSNENYLRKEFGNALPGDVEFKLGKPDEVEKTDNGYVYVYNYNIERKNGKVEQLYTRFSFDNNDNIRYIQSTNLMKQKRVSVGGIIFAAVAVPTLIIVLIASSQ